MSIFLPNYFFNKIWNITEEDLKKIGARLLILDVDNTLTEHKQIKKIAEEKGIPYLGNAHKPLSSGFKMVLNKFDVQKSSVAIIGDQIYTDILGGNLFGITTILVTPIKLENTFFFKLKRKLEVPFLKQIKK